MPLRPILKALHLDKPNAKRLSGGPPSVSSNPLPFAQTSVFRVHFPPTHPCTMTGAAYSPGTYDRAPILVSPNSCALPERGGRVYGGSPLAGPSTTPKGSYFHPRAYEACDAPESTADVPDLVYSTRDREGLFSSSESSEDCPSPDPSSPDPELVARIAGAPPLRSRHSQEHVLSFLPHPHPHSRPPTPGRGLLHPVQRERRRKPRPRPHSLSRRFSDEQELKDGDGCLGGF